MSGGSLEEDFSDDDEDLVAYPRGPSDKLPIHVAIVGTETVKDHKNDKRHVNYIIQVKHRKGVQWKVSRRFNQFDILHQTLKNTVDKANIPKFPKKSIRRTFKESSINKKTLKLSRYLQGVSMIPRVSQVDSFSSFLVASLDDLLENVKALEEEKSKPSDDTPSVEQEMTRKISLVAAHLLHQLHPCLILALGVLYLAARGNRGIGTAVRG